MSKVRTFHSVDAPAGSGKTYQAIRYALTQAAIHQRKTVLVFKSIELAKQALWDAHGVQAQSVLKVSIRAIHSECIDAMVSGFSVSAGIAEHLAEAKQGVGEILMITEAAFSNVEHWPNRWMWICICDEIPAVAPEHKLNIPDNHQMLTNFLQLGPDSDGYSRVMPTPAGKATLLRYAENSARDEINTVMSELARHIISPYFLTYVKTQQYQRVCAGNGEPGARQLQMFSLLQPSLFGSGNTRAYQEKSGIRSEVKDEFAEVILMGAGFQSSLLGLIWPKGNLQFCPQKEISKGLRYSMHDCGPRLRIQYLFVTDWSKSFRDSTSLRNHVHQTNLSLLIDAIAEEFQGNGFVFLVNKDVQDHARDRFVPIDGTQLPNAAWGLNEFQHIHQTAILSALNPTPAHVKFFDHMGLNGNAVRAALYHSQVYQAVMRNSLRDAKATQDVQIILPDRDCAVALGRMFPGCTVEKLDRQIEEAEPKPVGKPKSKVTKSKALTRRETRQRNRTIDKEIKRIQAGGTVDDQLLELFQRECRADNKSFQHLLEVIEENR